MPSRLAPFSLAALLTSSGVIHFVRPSTFTDLVPSWVPGTAHQVVYVSGAAELAVAALVANPKTRRLGGYAAAALFVAVFPGNLKMALDPGGASSALKYFAYARLPLQIPLVWWGLRVARGDGATPDTGASPDAGTTPGSEKPLARG
jgi:uncharacterized membrane protein